jgi:hypothetical protein
MDWMNRGERAPQGPVTAGSAQAATVGHSRKNKAGGFNLWRAVTGILLFSGTILVVALLLLIARGNHNDEAKYVDHDKFQAVFLNGGQVYFGKIKTLDNKYMSLKDIYYLRVNQQVQPNQANSNNANDISLVKLGCELHGPQDQMQINREQILFWENLKSDGQVAKAVAEYVKQNPNGQKCDSNATTNSSTNTSTTPTTTTPTTTTPTTNTNKKTTTP